MTSAAPIKTQSAPIKVGAYIDVDFPSLNKNDKLADNDKAIENGRNRSRCLIERVIDVTLADYCAIGSNLLADTNLWNNIGGQDLSDLDREAFGHLCRQHGADSNSWQTWASDDELTSWFRNHCFTCVVAVTSEGLPPFFVNTEGYSYARYVGRAA